jgi:thiamine biosynthesis lipoprotein
MQLAVENNLNILMLVREGDRWRSLASPAFVNYFGDALIDELGIEPWAAPTANRQTETGE